VIGEEKAARCCDDAYRLEMLDAEQAAALF
jgi:hypothetical protein